MSRSSEETGKNGCPKSPEPARDLVDFHLRWDEFRPVATRVLNGAKLDPHQAETLRWLIALADRVGMQDID